MEVEDIHPFRRKHITEVIPFLKVFQIIGCCKKKKDLRYAMRLAIINELRENYEPAKGVIPIIPKNEEHSDDNPFLLAGYGVNSFFDIMRRLVIMFIAISVVLIPTILIYQQNKHQGVCELEEASWKSSFHSMTLGNLGGAETQCITKRLNFDPEAAD